MAEVAEFPFTIDGFEDEEPETVGSFSYWPYDFDQIYSSDSEADRDPFSPSDHLNDEQERVCIGSFGSDDDGLCDFFGQENNEVHNLRSHSNAITVTDIYDEDPFFRVIHENNENETSSNYLDLGLALGRIDEEQGDDDDGDNGGFMVGEDSDDDGEICGGDFLVGRRVREARESSSEDVDEGLRMVGIGSDSDEEVDDGIIGVDFRSCDEDGFGEVHDDLGIPLCWDSLQLEDPGEGNDFCEWEEVGERDDADLLGMIVDDDERLPIDIYDVVEGREESTRNLDVSSSLHRNGQYDWQVLLQANDLEENVDSEHDFDLDNDDFIYPAEYDTLFGQFLDTDSTIRGSPPAAKSVVENLPSIVLSQDDIKNKGGLCAVCKDEISTEEQAKQLPCSHFYHGECILPWLNIRNTCPVCRFELPTDDQEYEQRRTQRAGSGRSQILSHVISHSYHLRSGTDSTIRGSPPADILVAEKLLSFILSQDDIKNKGGLCAVCKDEISSEEQAKQLPCSHYNHGECILPWLNIGNTCPVCRLEWPTDDQDYGQWRTQRAASGRSQGRLGFQLFNED